MKRNSYSETFDLKLSKIDIILSLSTGEISITLNSDWKEPKTNSSADTAAAERAQQFMLGWFAHPIYVNGDYPQVMTDFVKQKSDEENITSRLPEFTDDEKAEIKGLYGFSRKITISLIYTMWGLYRLNSICIIINSWHQQYL